MEQRNGESGDGSATIRPSELSQRVVSLEAERDRLSSKLEMAEAVIAERLREIEGLRRGLTAISRGSKRLSDGLLSSQRELLALKNEANRNKAEHEALRRRAAEMEEFGAWLDAAKDEASAAPVADSQLAPRAPIVVVDGGVIGDDLEQQLIERGHSVISLVSDPYCGFELTEHAPILSINLAVPGAWGSVRRLCGGDGYTKQPIVAYAFPTGGDRGAWLGAVDFAILPLDDSQLNLHLRERLPHLRRALLISPDIELIGQIRTLLEQSRVSVSVMLDSRQTIEMVPIVRPDLAIVHLSPAYPDAFRVIADLRRDHELTSIPFLFILDAAAQPADVAFLMAGMQELALRGRFAAPDLANACLDRLLRSLYGSLEVRQMTENSG